VKDIKSVRAGETLFFKHKYLTQPTITTSDALIKVADDLSKAVNGVIPQKGATMEDLEQLVDIFKQQAKEKEDSATRQRVHKENALTQRVQMEEAQMTLEVEEQPTDTPLEHPTNNNSIPMVSQDMEEEEDEEEGPATRTRARASTRTITQEVLLQMADVSGSGSAITARSAASRKFPMQFLCDYANAVLDGETGELL